MDASRLGAVPLFADLPDDELAAIAAVASDMSADAGQALATEGEFGHCLFAIETGSAEVLSDGEVLRKLGPGDVFGEIAVIASGRRTATVVATEPLQLITIFKRDVWALDESAPQAATRLRALIEEHRAHAT